MFLVLINLLCHLFIYFFFFFFFGNYGFFLFSNDYISNFLINLIPFLIIFFLISSFLVKNPINTLLLILISFILSGVLLWRHSIEFLTYIFLIVYIGALMMLFLFIIMLFNLQQIPDVFKRKEIFFFNFLIFIIFILFYNNFFDETFYSIAFKNIINFNFQTEFSVIFFFSNITTDGIKALETLYTIDNILFYFLTFLLLFTLISSINLAMVTKQKI